MKDLVLLALGSALTGNLVLTYFLGICPFLGVSRRLDMAAAMGIAVTFVLAVSGTATYLLRTRVLLPLDIDFLQYVAFILVIAGTVQVVEMYVRKRHPGLYAAFGMFLPMISTNCAILGGCLFIGLRGFGTLLEVLVYCLASGLGYTLALVVMGGIREELALADVPEPFRGAPIAFVVAGNLALAFMGFAGLGTSR